MALVIPPGFAAFSLEVRHSGVSRSSFITGGVDISAEGGDSVEAANDVLGAFGPLAGNLGSSCSFQSAQLRIGQDGGDPVAVVSTAAAIAGTNSAAMVPVNCSVLVGKYTGRGGRRGRGRWFLPWCIAENSVDESGVITPDHVAGLQTSIDAVLAAFTANTVPLVLLHNAPATDNDPTPVTSMAVSSLIGSQRRRLGR